MKPLIIILGLLLGLIPSFISPYNQKTKKLNGIGILLIFISIIFIVLSVRSENNDELDQVIYENKIDSLASANLHLTNKVNKLKETNYAIRDSLIDFKRMLLKKDNEIFKSVQNHRKESFQYQKVNEDLHNENIKILKESKQINSLKDEPFISTQDVKVKKNKSDFTLSIHASNFGKRPAMEFKVMVNHFMVNPYSNKINTKVITESDDPKTFEIPGQRKFTMDHKLPSIILNGFKLDLIILMKIEYHFKDKIQKNKKLVDEDIYALTYKNGKYYSEKGTENHAKMIEEYLKNN